MRSAGVVGVGVLISACAAEPVASLTVQASVEFPPTACRATRALRVENTSRLPARFTRVSLTSGTPVQVLPIVAAPNAVFSLALPDELAPGATVDVPVQFLPQLGAPARVFEAQVRLEAGSSAFDVSLSGARALPEPPRGLLDFGPVEPGDTFDLAFPLAEQGLSNERLPSGPFSRVGDSVRFSPPATGEWSSLGRWDYRPAPDCEPGRLDVLVQGVGHHPVVSSQPLALDFGFTPPGLSLAAALTLENLSLRPVRVTGFTVTGPSAGAFVVGWPDAGLLLPAAHRDGGVGMGLALLRPGRASLDVGFAPQTLQGQSANLELTTSLPSLPTVVVPLRGVGGGPDIEVLPEALDFGEITAATTRPLRVGNVGARPNPPDPNGNLHLGPDGGGPFYELLWVSGVRDNITITFPFFDPGVGIEGMRDLTIQVTALPGPSEHLLRLFTNDLDEPVVTVRITTR